MGLAWWEPLLLLVRTSIDYSEGLVRWFRAKKAASNVGPKCKCRVQGA